jgi:hypothetical protein
MTTSRLSDDERQRRWRSYIEREGLASLMNDTKWRQLVFTLEAHWDCPRWRVKRLTAAEPDIYHGDYEPHLYGMEWRSVEWLDLDPIVTVSEGKLFPKHVVANHTPAIEKALRSVYAPFSHEGDLIRVWGYARPGKFPSIESRAEPKAGG